MRHDYEMTVTNPCPSCHGVHLFTREDGVPFWDPHEGAVFSVVCPVTGALVEVVVPPETVEVPNDPPTALGLDTGVLCPVCRKANFHVSREQGKGPVVVQYVECGNRDCQYEEVRRWNRLSRSVIP